MDKIDQRATDYNAGYKKAKEDFGTHSKPSPQTIKEINDMKINMAELKGGMERIEQKVGDHIEQQEKDMKRIEEANEKINIKIDEFIKGADCKYADKKTEQNVDKLMWIVLTAVLGMVLMGGLGFYFLFIKNLT